MDEEDHMLVRLMERLPLPPLRRRNDTSASLVEFVDLLVVLLKSGRTTHQSFECIARWGDGEVSRVAERVLQRCERGERLADATSELITVFGSAAVGIANTLAAAERDGLPIAPVLDRLVGEAHSERRRQAQIDAAKLPIKLAFPLVACVLPSFVALTVVPILIGALSSLTLGPPTG
jgi:tight adherence protein C